MELLFSWNADTVSVSDLKILAHGNWPSDVSMAQSLEAKLTRRTWCVEVGRVV